MLDSEPIASLNRHLEILGMRIRELRLARAWSQQLLAGRAGLDRTYIRAIERGRQNITLGAIYKLARAFELPLERLVEVI